MVETSSIIMGSENNNLIERIIEFNLCPVSYIHGSWLKKVKYAQLVKLLCKKDQSHSYLSQYLLGHFGLNADFDYEFDVAEKRVALASSEELIQLVLYIGIVLNERVIRSVVKREDRVKLEQCLGEDAYYFAVKKAQFLLSAIQGDAPGILVDWNNTDRFKSSLMLSGLQVLAIVYADMTQAFRKRLLLKLPRSWRNHLEHPQSDIVSKEQGLSLLIKSYKEVNRQWQHLLS
ncbi:MAG: SctK family type III secretion system sorting platform protein [Candidatus Endonucleobacter bathymodioli]|uniref:SctK family type III secretion system sorting platform protein n=1 Tax=Candidatus Endonucleibacter bathymodioli TaxID=539814 RepID=A0AA90NJS2_9GAMM|nr:SctK family type III secretion system sorting platform protein [Candidatus Endonucleobacter bathymodioli]